MNCLRSLFTFSALVIIFIRCSNVESTGKESSSNKELQKQLSALVKDKEYFKLKEAFDSHAAELNTEQKLYYTAILKNVFNQLAESSRCIDSLLQFHHAELSDSERIFIWQTQRDNFIKTFQYRQAAMLDDTLLANYDKKKDSAKLAEIRNSKIIDNGLAAITPQTVALHRNDTINWQRNRIGLMEVPVRVRNTTYHFVFDTRASISVITRTFAKRLGLRLLNVSYEEHSGLTGNAFQSSLGIADSLYLGKTLIRNAVFQVVPDSVLQFPSIHFTINGIFGFPMIKELEQVSFSRTGQLIVGGESKRTISPNLVLDGSTTVLALKTDDDLLSFHFDLGATNTLLYHNYFEKYRKTVEQKAKLQTTQLGGAGGTEERKVYILPHLNFYIGGEKVVLDSVDILTKPIYPGQKHYGNIGQDLVNKFQKMTINFRKMFVDFE